ncbi:hypothetical protein ONV78_13345 [Hahella sp. CR1]|uniref:hypothetical protein n=1 Tax=Hahella sp. CR1 TaxID=2992807 RepID=UPI0024417AE5|nr:hypothetical protein [Hahella sp. CR1]MDG9668722.1 hypothetical protein [Hahella sp. CR1]
MKDFIDKIKWFKRYRHMYLPAGTLDEATGFVSGMDFMLGNVFGDGFRNWLLKSKIREKSSFSWPKLVSLYIEDQGVGIDCQVDVFLDLIFEYIETHWSDVGD